ncbi:MAG: ATPase, T2SS/T4P/T4SS family, partial [candidate division KSB1 bacterium]|nr:ATPase, T2SS/T4P/T4SS family [candidate division KSB1 bacterium]
MALLYKKLGEMLLEKNLITREQLNLALEIQQKTKDKLGKIFVEKGWVTEETLLDVLSQNLKIPKIKLDSYVIDPAIITIVPQQFALKYQLMPLFKVGDELTVAMSDPLDIFAIDALHYRTRCKIHVALASEKDILQAIEKYYTVKDSMDRVIRDLDKAEVAQIKEEKDHTSTRAIVEDSDEASVIKLVNLFILQAIKDKASDIHVEPDEGMLRIRYRVDGVLREAFTPPKQLHPMIISRIKIMADLDVAERRIPQDGRFHFKAEKKEVDVRVSILPTVEGEKAVLRILDKTSVLFGLEEMGFSEDNLQQWRSLIRKPEGIILITGPTGSGKTTTLYGVLKEINSVEKNIVTVENPVEYKFPLINQVQINPKAGLTFSTGLRAVLRQDPDIIMIGEIRDLESAEIAIRSALTGHLVLSSIHANDAVGVIFRLLDLGVEPFLISSSLVGIVAQRMIRRI